MVVSSSSAVRERVLGDGVDGEVRAPRRRLEVPLARGVGQIEAARLADAAVVLREAGDDVLDVLADAVVVVDQALPVDASVLLGAERRHAPCRPTMAGSLRRCSEPGGRTPRDMMNDARGVFDGDELLARSSAGRVRCGRGRGESAPCSPVIRWPRLSLVEICTVSRQRGSASDVYLVSGVALRKFPPRPTKTFTLPSCIACDGPHRVEAVLFGRREVELLARAPARNCRAHLFPDADGAIALHVAVAAHGQRPAPRRPIWPRSSAKLTMLCTLATPFLCCVMPIAQQQIIRSESIAICGGLADERRARCRSPARSSPSARGVEIARERLEAFGVMLDEVVREQLAAGGAILLQHLLHDALEQRHVAVDPHRQKQARRSSVPRPSRRQRLLRVLEADQPGLGQRIDADDLAAVARGLLQLGQHARMAGAGILADDEDASACSKSSIFTVALPMPIDSVSPGPLDSWHMFEQSGRLLVPNWRAKRP